MPSFDGSVALARQMVGPLLRALGVWVGVVVLVSAAGMVRLMDTRYACTTGLARFAMLFWRCLLVVLVVDLVLCLVSGWPSLQAPLWGMLSRALAFALSSVALLFGGLGAIALIGNNNPWEYLPGGPPFALREFARKHPHLRVQTLGFGGTVMAVTNGTTRAIFDESELRKGFMTWEECANGAEPERLGGPPPYPGARCLARIRIRRPDYSSVSDDEDAPPPELRTTKYVYSVAREFPSAVRQYYLDWEKRAGLDPRVWSEVVAGGRTWRIATHGVGRTVDGIDLEYAETHSPATR